MKQFAITSALVILIAGVLSSPATAAPDVARFAYETAEVSIEQARKVALEAVGGTIIKEEYESKRGRNVYEFYIRKSDGSVYEVYVDADTGKVVKIESK